MVLHVGRDANTMSLARVERHPATGAVVRAHSRSSEDRLTTAPHRPDKGDERRLCAARFAASGGTGHGRMKMGSQAVQIVRYS